MHDIPLILTCELEPLTQERFERERRQHFPPERNHIPAHVSMFHALPGAEEAAIVAGLRTLHGRPQPGIEVAGVRSLGHGVAYQLRSPALEAMRAELAREWSGWLGAQDRQGYRPHVTVQNKVPVDLARETFTHLNATFAPWASSGAALRLWRYLGGPWESVERVAFRG